MSDWYSVVTQTSEIGRLVKQVYSAQHQVFAVDNSAVGVVIAFENRVFTDAVIEQHKIDIVDQERCLEGFLDCLTQLQGIEQRNHLS